jgi:hypothetical protein
VIGTESNRRFVVGHVEFSPAEKVMKRLTNGLEDHLGHYFETIVTCLEADDGSRNIVIG